MKNCYYFSGLLLVLAFFGFGSERTAVPNQEIVIQFSDVEVTLEETQDAITAVKGQLETLAATNIRLQELGKGTLKITYYSTTDVSQVRELLLKGRDLAHAASITTDTDSEFPLTNGEKYYEIGIHTLQDGHDLVGTSSEGFLESKSESIRYFTPTTDVSVQPFFKSQIPTTNSVAFAVYYHIMITVDESSYKIPEVRAGPLA